MEMDIGVTGQPAIMLGLVRIEVVEDDMDLLVRRVAGDEFVHEVEEFASSSPLVVLSPDHARSDVKCCEQR